MENIRLYQGLMYFITKYFNFQNKESQDEGGQVEEDGVELHYEAIPIFIQEVGGDL